MTFIDSNVIFDVVTNDPKWMVWSRFQLERAAALGPLVINDIIYAEVSVRYATIESVESLISELKLEILPIKKN